MAIGADRELGALVERELAAQLDRHDQPPLRAKANGNRAGAGHEQSMARTR